MVSCATRRPNCTQHDTICIVSSCTRRSAIIADEFCTSRATLVGFDGKNWSEKVTKYVSLFILRASSQRLSDAPPVVRTLKKPFLKPTFSLCFADPVKVCFKLSVLTRENCGSQTEWTVRVVRRCHQQKRKIVRCLSTTLNKPVMLYPHIRVVYRKTVKYQSFYSASALLTMPTAVIVRPFLSARPSVCPSVRYIPVFCLDK